MKWIKAFCAFLFLTFGGAFNCQVLADDAESKPDEFIHIRSYIGILGVSSTVDQLGDFNGVTSMTFFPGSSSSTTTYPEVDLIPAIDRNFGWGAMGGHREGPWAAEFSFWRTEHTANFYTSAPSTITSPAALQAINIDFKRYFFTQVPTQPFVSLGLSIPWLWIRQYSYQFDPTFVTNTFIGDETISGIGLNLGAGMEIYLGQDFSLIGGIVRRWTAFDQINGVSKIPLNEMYFDGNQTDIGSLAGDGLNFYIATTISI